MDEELAKLTPRERGKTGGVGRRTCVVEYNKGWERVGDEESVRGIFLIFANFELPQTRHVRQPFRL